MSTSPSAEDLYKYIGMTFEQAKKNPKLAEKFSRVDGVLKVITTEPDGVMLIDIAGAGAVAGAVDDPADATLRMTCDFANRFFQGDLNLLSSVTSGAITMEGKMTTLAKAVGAAKEMFPTYIEVLKSNERADLLVK
ncbi:hypothetical protein JCM9803A_02830 [Rhodococcus erythropolis]